MLLFFFYLFVNYFVTAEYLVLISLEFEFSEGSIKRLVLLRFVAFATFASSL